MGNYGKYQTRYRKEHYTTLRIALNNEKDADLIDALDYSKYNGKRNDFIKNALRKAVLESKNKTVN